MRCSICMSTRNKAEILDRTLSSIRDQSVLFDYEVVVADDGSTDSTREVCRKHGVRYLYLDNDRYRNPSRARNDAYRFASGEIVIAQSDDVVHHSPRAITDLVEAIRPGHVVIATVLNMVAGTNVPFYEPFHIYSGLDRPRAFFFLGAIYRKDIYAVGGNDEEFVEPCWDDNWFQDCLLEGLHLKIHYAPHVIGYHQSHEHPAGAHQNDHLSRNLYIRKSAEARMTGRYVAAPWPLKPSVIPRTMSFFWGGTTLSWMRYMTLASFRYWHPDWTMRLYRMKESGASRWTSHEQEDALVYHQRDNYLDRLGALNVTTLPWECPVPDASATHACDLCQWEILSGEGGFYSDMDILYVGPIDYDTVGHADVMFCLSLGYMTIGLMGAASNSPVFDLAREEARRRYDPKAYQSTGAEALYGLAGIGDTWTSHEEPGRKTVAHLRNMFPTFRFRELPSGAVYPWNYMEVEKIFEETHHIPSDCFCIHWFGANPVAQRWNNRLTHRNFTSYENTFTQYAKRCGV